MTNLQKSLLVFALLAMATLACNTAMNILGGEDESESGTAPGTAAPTATFTPLPTRVAPTEIPTEADPDQPKRRTIPPTPTPFHAISDEDVRNNINLAEPDHYDYFDDPNTWLDYDTEDAAAYWFEDGKLVGLDYVAEDRYSWWSNTDRQSGNVYAEISATNGDCIDKDSVGFVIRVDEVKGAGGYALEVSCDGHWQVRRHRPGKAPQEMIGWTEADVINQGPFETNRLAIWGYQDNFEFFINGVKVGEAQDPAYSYSYGTFAVYVRGYATHELKAEFDDFAYWHVRYLE
jgi:hypothetical protein